MSRRWQNRTSMSAAEGMAIARGFLADFQTRDHEDGGNHPDDVGLSSLSIQGRALESLNVAYAITDFTSGSIRVERIRWVDAVRASNVDLDPKPFVYLHGGLKPDAEVLDQDLCMQAGDHFISRAIDALIAVHELGGDTDEDNAAAGVQLGVFLADLDAAAAYYADTEHAASLRRLLERLVAGMYDARTLKPGTPFSTHLDALEKSGSLPAEITATTE